MKAKVAFCRDHAKRCGEAIAKSLRYGGFFLAAVRLFV